MKAINTKTNSKGIQYALVVDNDKYGVYKLCENYARHIKGGIAKSWRYIQKNMSFDDANKLFLTRTK
jgi:hypothetical protein